jgi:hypothetical protein
MKLILFTMTLFLATLSLADESSVPVLKKPKCTARYSLDPVMKFNNSIYQPDHYYQALEKAENILASKGYQQRESTAIGYLYVDVSSNLEWDEWGHPPKRFLPSDFTAKITHYFGDPWQKAETGVYFEKKLVLKRGYSLIAYQKQWVKFVQSLPNCEDLRLIRKFRGWEN